MALINYEYFLKLKSFSTQINVVAILSLSFHDATNIPLNKRVLVNYSRNGSSRSNYYK